MKKAGEKMKRCYLVGAGENYGIDFVPSDEDMVIAVDGGFIALKEADIRVDLVVGDYDSLGYCPDSENVIELPCVKDDTDMLAAIKEGIKKGYTDFIIYGGMGGRIDHTFANVQLLSYLSSLGRRGFLVSKDNILTAITDGQISLPSGNEGIVSVFSLSEKSYGVYEKGLKYELEADVLTNLMPLGVSNEFCSKDCMIKVTKGTLLIVFPKDVIGLI